MHKTIDFAIDAVNKGYYVAPACRPKVTEKGCFDHFECPSPGKVPIHRHSSITNNVDQVRRLWTKNYNILVKTRESNLVVLDLDLKPDKPDGLAWFNRNRRSIITRQHRTGSGGTHAVYRVDNQSVTHGDRICRGLDLRGTCANHYVIWIGSRHENGRFYEVIDDTEPEILPQWLIDEITVTKGKFNPDICNVDTILEQLWNAAGLPILGTDDRTNTIKHWIPCLMESCHSSGRNSFDCVMMSGQGIGRWGAYVCQHQSHKKITVHKAIDILKDRVTDEVYEEIVGRYRVKSTKAYNFGAFSVEHCTDRITELFDSLDDKVGKVIVVQVSPGVGKSEGSLRYLGSHGNKPTNVFVPNHKLAEEFQERLEARTGILAAHPRGISNFKDNVACVFPNMIAEASRLRLPIRQNICITCPHFNNYRQSGSKCVAAHTSESMAGKHRILQHSTLDAVLRNIGDGTNKIVIVDEQPELVSTLELKLKVLEDEDVFDLYGIDEREIKRYRELAGYITKASRIFSGYATARDVVSVGTNGAQIVFDFNDKCSALLDSIKSNELPYPYETAAKLSHQITQGNNDAIKRLRRLADVFTILYGLRTACLYPNRETFNFNNGIVTLRVPANWIVEAVKYTQTGGSVLLMSATANSEVLKETLGDIAEFIQIHARDAPGITRSFRYDNRVSRKVLCPEKVVNKYALRGALSRVYEDAVEYGNVEELLLITHKPVADALRQDLSEYLPIPWIRQIEAGGIIHVAHYGSIVGLDQWKNVDVVVTMGDPIPSLDVAYAEARALGVREDSYLKSKIQGESLQAQGRIRACRRTEPGFILHVGLHKPDVVLDPSWKKWLLPDVELNRVRYVNPRIDSWGFVVW